MSNKVNSKTMAIDILVPPLSQTMDSLVLVKWEKQVGDPVEKGEVLFVVETDKATMDVESPGTGILLEILALPGSEVPVRSKIGTLLPEGEAQTQTGQPAVEQESQAAPTSSSVESTETLSAHQQARIFSSPRARKLAQKEGISLADVKATGPRRMIVQRDIQAYLDQEKTKPKVTPLAKRVAEDTGVDLEALQLAHRGKWVTRNDVDTFREEQAPILGAEESTPSATEPAPASEPPLPSSRRIELTNIRKTISRRMQESHQTTAPVTLTREVDATELKLLRERILLELEPGATRPSYTDFLIVISSRCLRKHPVLNGTFNGDTVELQEEVHMALAVDTERGLIVPVIHAAQHMGLVETARARKDIAQRALEDKVDPEELAGGTFTITNLGNQGIDAFTPIINPPQIAILGIGRIHPAAMIFEGQIAVRERMYLSLTFDHRIVDGAPAARFLQDIAQLIENPHRIWL
jgi:pyruvate dehydrogenase E2 component (dihydrolipoamide acetyltransferase)